MKVACIQPKVFQDIEKCYAEVEILLKDLLDKSSDCTIACLPERWTPLSNDIPQNFQEERGKNYMFIKELAKKYEVSIISGAIWEKRNDSKKPFITSYYFNKKGVEIGRQDKLHLYSYEKKIFKSGRVLNLFSLKNIKFSILICFDMAFFMTPRLAVENGADILFSPTQIVEFGMENWKIYLKARALENRIPVVGCNTVGTFNGRKFPGNSKIISFEKGFKSPSKLRVIEGPIELSGFIYDDIDLTFPKKLRKIRLNEKIGKDKISVRKITS